MIFSPTLDVFTISFFPGSTNIWNPSFTECFPMTYNSNWLTHSARVYFKKLALQKKAKHPTLNASISKTKTNLE